MDKAKTHIFNPAVAFGDSSHAKRFSGTAIKNWPGNRKNIFIFQENYTLLLRKLVL